MEHGGWQSHGVVTWVRQDLLDLRMRFSKKYVSPMYEKSKNRKDITAKP